MIVADESGITLHDLETLLNCYFSVKYKVKGNNSSVPDEGVVETLSTFLTIDDIQKLLKVSRPVVTAYIKNGRLPAAKVGNQYRIYRGDFVRFWYDLVGENNQRIAEDLFDLLPDEDPLKRKRGGRRPGGYKY